MNHQVAIDHLEGSIRKITDTIQRSCLEVESIKETLDYKEKEIECYKQEVVELKSAISHLKGE